MGMGVRRSIMKALFRIYLGNGKYLAVFTNTIIIEYYEDGGELMTGIHVII
jgi:hypothetical protein